MCINVLKICMCVCVCILWVNYVCMCVVVCLFGFVICLVYLTSVAVHLHGAVHLALVVVVAVVPSNYMLKHPKLLN